MPVSRGLPTEDPETLEYPHHVPSVAQMGQAGHVQIRQGAALIRILGVATPISPLYIMDVLYKKLMSTPV